PTGEIKDSQSTPPTPPTTPPEAKAAELKPTEAPATKPESKPSVLNEAKPTAPAGAPEKNESLKAPEGYKKKMEATASGTNNFKEIGLSQDQAQKVMDLYNKEVVQAENAPYRAWEDMQEKWRNEIQQDPELGGKLDQVKSTTARLIDGLGDPRLAQAFREAMDFTGAGNNPAFIRTFYRIAQRMTEGGAATGGGPAGSGPGQQRPASVAAALYPNLTGR